MTTQPSFDFGLDFHADAARVDLQAAEDALSNARAIAREIARELAEDGRPEREIAVRLGVTRTSVRRWVAPQRFSDSDRD